MTNAADEYVKLCEDSSRLPDVFDFLSKIEGLAAREKLDVLLVDQFHRWQQQQAIPVEHYVKRLPELEEIHVVSLLVEEYGQLEERGIAPDAPEFVKRYHDVGTEAFALLCEELDIDQSSGGSGSSPANGGAVSVRRFGRYEVVCTIGKGAFGEVFLGKDPSLDRSVAIKVPTRQRIEMGGGAEALLNEARLLAKIDHPNIVPVYDHGQTEQGDCFIVSKYVKGKELRSELRKSIAHLDAARISAALARALHAAHRAGVIHRDLKPANVVLDGHGQPHLLDFGLAMRGHNNGSEGAFIGTPAYMSPEQARCESHLVDGRTDIYSLGVVLYEMLAGRRPFQGRSTDEHLQHTESAEVQPPRQFVDSIPRDLERICLKALSHKIADRFPTAGDFAEEIERWIETTSTEAARASHGHDQKGSAIRTDSSLRWQGYGQLPEGPSIAVLPFKVLGGHSAEKGLADGLSEEIITQLAKFKDLFILGRHATVEYDAERVNVKEAGQKLGVHYLLTGSVRRAADQLRVTAQLIDTETSAHIWAKSFRSNLSTQDVFDIEDTIAENVAVCLGLHDGVIARSRMSSRKNLSAGIDAYDSVTGYYENWRAPKPKILYDTVRQNLEATVAREPKYFAAWAALSFVYLDAFVWDFAVEESHDEMLTLAGEAARRATDGAPQDARSLHAMFRYEFHSGHIESFMDVLELAIEANPNEANMLADAAMCLACLGDWDRARTLIRKAIALNPNPPVWYHVTECWHAMVLGDFETALNQANRMNSVGVYWAPALRACAYGHLDRIEEAQQELMVLAELQPDFVDRFAREMQAWNVNIELQQATLGGFAKAGLLPG
ncbi:MAG: protein kinase [Fuerstiella sp.]